MIDSTNKQLSIRLFEPQEVHHKYIRGKRLVYLDTAIWIDLADHKDEIASKCIRIMKQTKADGKLICPLSYASVTEVLNQSFESGRLSQVKIMDELSDGVTFRLPKEIAEVEAGSACPVIFGEAPTQMDYTRLFSHVFDFPGASALSFPSGWNQSNAEKFITLMKSNIPAKPLEWLVQHLPLEKMREKHRELGHDRIRKLDNIRSSQKIEYQKNKKLDQEKILLNERIWIFKNIALPLLRNALIERYGMAEVVHKIQTVEKDLLAGSERLTALFGAMPTLELFSQIMAARVGNPLRKNRMEDFYDHLHAHPAPAYVSVFATKDRGLVDLLRNRCSLPRERGCTIIGSTQELTEWLITTFEVGQNQI